MRIRGLVILVVSFLLGANGDVIGQTNLFKANEGKLLPTATFSGKHYIERIGYALCGAGDVNGDGFDDFLIGTFHNAVMGSDAGAAYLFLGRSRFPWTFDSTVDSADARFLGQMTYDAAGYSVACDGDLNGDGFDDILIGAPAGNDKVPWQSGRVYIVFGRKAAQWGRFFHLYDSSNVIYEGEGGQDLAGLSVAYIGDINLDGFDDFLVGAPFKDGKFTNEGKVYLILGRSSPWLSMDYLSYANAGFRYDREGAEVGYSVAGIGDVNADGIPDFAIGANSASRIFIIYGRKNANWGMNFSLDNADAILYGKHQWVNEGVGWKVAGGGDANGDGIDDVLVSAIHDDEGGFNAGKAYILFGKKSGWGNQIIALNDGGDASFVGELPGDQAGWGVGFAGDVNADGYDDFLIGTYKDENGPVDGKAYLVKGKSIGWQMNTPLSAIPDYCERTSEGIGFAVATAGDFDGDGIDDFVISAPFYNGIQKWMGKVHLFASQQIAYQVAGNVKYHLSGNSVPNAILQADTPATASDTTDLSGCYRLFLRGKNDHTVSCLKDRGSDVGAAVSAYDAALIARLSINLPITGTINSQAADVNLDGKINMYDAANTLRCAVQLPSLQDSHAGEWSFSPGSVQYDSILSDYFGQNFEGYIRGDVDIDWKYAAGPPLKIMSLSNQSLVKLIGKDENFSLPIEFPGDCSMHSFDLSISYDQDALEFVDLRSADLTRGFQIVQNTTIKNKILIGGYSLNPVTKSGLLFNVVFAQKQGGLHQTSVAVDRFQVNNMPGKTIEIELKFERDVAAPHRFQLLSNYPNPFNAATAIPYYVDKQGKVMIEIFNILGEHIVTLVDGTMLPGKYLVQWDGKDRFGSQVHSGVYICKASASSGTQKIKITYLK